MLYPRLATSKSLLTLTKRAVEALKPGADRFDVFDAQLRGFAVRVHPAGRKTYRFKYVYGGRQRVVTIGEHGAPWTTEAARTEAQILRGRVAAGDDPSHRQVSAAPLASLTVGAAIELWLRDGPAAAPNKRVTSWFHDASRLNRHIVPLLGDRPIATLERRDIEQAQRAIAEGATAVDVKTGKRGRAIVTGGRAAARSAVSAFSACLAWAAAQNMIVKNPALGVRKIAGVRRERFLNDAETAHLLATIDSQQEIGRLAPVFADAFRLLLLTGARKTEIAALAWDEVDLDRGVITLRQNRAKNGDKVVMLNQSAIVIIAARPRTSRYVLASATDPSKPIVGLQKAWTRVRGAAGLPGLRIHDLRHSYASLAASDGASLPMIAKALGHAHTSTSARYTHLADEAARRVADGVGERLAAARKLRPLMSASTSAPRSISAPPPRARSSDN